MPLVRLLKSAFLKHRVKLIQTKQSEFHPMNWPKLETVACDELFSDNALSESSEIIVDPGVAVRNAPLLYQGVFVVLLSLLRLLRRLLSKWPLEKSRCNRRTVTQDPLMWTHRRRMRANNGHNANYNLYSNNWQICSPFFNSMFG